MYTKTKKTVRLELTSNEDLATYDAIVNNPLCRVIRELQEDRSTTERFGEGESTTTKVPLLIVTYEERALA